jgi:NADPH-dependent curcumin reductase CurA
MRGFILPDLAPQFTGRFYSEIPVLVMEGKITSCERVIAGIENAPHAFVDMLRGAGQVGKAVIEVAKE